MLIRDSKNGALLKETYELYDPFARLFRRICYRKSSWTNEDSKNRGCRDSRTKHQNLNTAPAWLVKGRFPNPSRLRKGLEFVRSILNEGFNRPRNSELTAWFQRSTFPANAKRLKFSSREARGPERGLSLLFRGLVHSPSRSCLCSSAVRYQVACAVVFFAEARARALIAATETVPLVSSRLAVFSATVHVDRRACAALGDERLTCGFPSSGIPWTPRRANPPNPDLRGGKRRRRGRRNRVWRSVRRGA
jgi:hypothetical protein